MNILDFTNLNPPLYQFSNDHFDLTLLINQNQNQIPHDHMINAHQLLMPPYPSHDPPTTTTTVCEDDDSMPPSKLMRINNSSSLINCSTFTDPSITTSFLINSGTTNPPPHLPAAAGDFNNINGGIFCPDPPNYNSTQLLQAPSNESQHLANGGGSTGATPLASSELITSLEAADTFRVVVDITNKLTTEERKEKIHRYLKKRNQRNFSKKIKYACRKTLADSRPRVRGRFAKNNDEFGDQNIMNRSINNGSGHEEDTPDQDIVKSFHVVVKEEDENFESSDIFAHISGVNSFKCNYPCIQSWI